MTVVSNSSPLISLARIGRLDLLAALFGQIAIPPEVHHEVTATGQPLPGADEVKRADWIRVLELPSAPNANLVQRCEGLGSGEAAAIYLGRALNADLVLLDERKARRAANEVQLPIAGCLAVLETAFRRELVTDLRSCYIDLLRQGVRFDLRLLQGSLARFGLPPL